MADAAAPTPEADQQPGDPTTASGSTASPEADEAIATPAAAEPEVPGEVQEAGSDTPEPNPEPVPVAVPEAPEVPNVPTVATTIEVPPLASAPAGEAGNDSGGEWELLVDKLRQWLASGQLQQLWQTARTPLSATAALIGVLLVLRLYTALLGVLESLPLVPGLLELVGVIAVMRFGLTRLVRSSDRREVISNLQSRWRAFRGNR